MIYGNLAYKYDYIEEKRVKEQKKPINKTNKKTVKNKKAAKNKKTDISYAEKIAMVLIVAISAVFMIIQYVTVSETQSKLGDISAQYEFEESVTAQKAFELEQSIDLSKIENEATSRLGMRRPERHQIVYLDVKQSDVTVKTADEVEGFSNRFSDLIEIIKRNIIEFFSI